MVKKILDKEDKVIGKINNKYELAGYIFRYRTKELAGILIIILFGLVMWLWLTRVTPEEAEKTIKEKIKSTIEQKNELLR